MEKTAAMDQEGEMKQAEEVIAVMESFSTVINTDDEFHQIQQVAQNLRSLVNMCQINQKEIQAGIQGITPLPSWSFIRAAAVIFFIVASVCCSVFASLARRIHHRISVASHLQ